MALSEIQQTILDPFVGETLEILGEMADMDGHTGDSFLDTAAQFRFHGYAICSETRGSLDGVILMHHYIETALALGNAIRKNILEEDLEYEEVNELVADALAEWGNTVIGRAGRRLRCDQLGMDFEPPYFVYDMDTMSSLLTGIVDIITVPVHVEGIGRFYFNLLIRKISDELATVLEDPPAAEASASPVSGESVVLSEKLAPLGKHKKILVVDDMKTVQNSMINYLAKIGYKNVLIAANGVEAVELFRKEEPDFLFMDVVMPEMTGNQALKEIRTKSKEVPVVMLSSVADQGMIQECKNLGITGYIIKPLTAQNGPDTLKEFLCA